MYESAVNGSDAVPSSSAYTMSSDGQRVQVILEMVSADAPIPENLGIIIETTYENLVQATVSIRNLEAISSDENVLTVMIPPRPQQENHVISEGVLSIRSNVVNDSGYTGKGVKVAVIDSGFDINNHEIAGNIAKYESYDESNNDIAGSNDNDTKHGTAVAEIIVDIAPKVELYLYNYGTHVEFYNLIDDIISSKDIDIDIISMSLGIYNVGPANGTSDYAKKVNDARDRGILFIKSAGNSANQHWQGTFSDPDGDKWHNFQGADNNININVSASDTLHVYLSWWDVPSEDTPSEDYDLFLHDADGNVLARSVSTQPNVPPIESITFPATDDMTVYVGIDGLHAENPVDFQLFTSLPMNEYAVPESSITIPGDAVGSFTVGATNVSDGMLENYSSRGPTLGGEIKPDITGPTRVSTSAYDRLFPGTSAAAPHVAGAAALVKQKYPDATADDIQTILESITANRHAKSNEDGTGRLSVNMLAYTDILALDNSNPCDPCFYPETFEINPGDNVTWVNTTNSPISITGGSGANSFTIPNFERYDLRSYGFDHDDIVEYYDTLHHWATGKIIVGTPPPPTLLYAGITGPNQITTHFSEIVYATTSDFTDLQLIPGGSRTISSVSGSGTDTLMLTFSGQTASVNATATMDIGSGITNAVNTPFESADNYPIASGQSPRITQAMFAGPSTISIKFSEPVVADMDDFTDFKVKSAINNDLTFVARNISTIGGSGTDTIHVTAQGSFNLDTIGTIDIASSIVDLFGNTLAGNLDNYPVDRDQRPSIVSAEITGNNIITIKFSEPVTTSSGDYTDLKITYDPTNDGDASDEITMPFSIDPSNVNGSGSDTVTLAVRETIPSNATGSIDLSASKYTQDSNGARTYTSMIDNRGQILQELTSASDTNVTYNPDLEPYPINEQPYVMNNDYPLRDDRNSQEVSDRGTVTGVVFSDDNGNGIKDVGELGVRTSITLTTNNPFITNTGNDGSYAILHVMEGTYTISVVIPDGYASVPSQTVTVEGDKTKTVNFALKPLVTISGTVFNDVNNNGIMDAGESGMFGATVSINTTPVKTATTNATGMYSIDMVPAGSYTLTVTQSGYADITKDITAIGGTTNTEDFALGSVGTVMGTIYNDMNNNGIMDADESGIPNITVSITGTSLTAMTNSDGTYSIGMVPAGQQTVTIPAQDDFSGDVSKTVTVGVNPVNFALVPVGTVMGTVSNSISGEGISGITVNISDTLTATTDSDGMYTISMVPVGTFDIMLDVSDRYLGSISMEVTVSHGMSATVDFALTPVGTITGVAFSDTNGNGIKDNFETGIAGITVSITNTNITTVTDNDGMYTIRNVPVGDYVVTVSSTDTHFVVRANMSVTVTQGGTAEANFTLVPRIEAKATTISGVVFNDINGDGMQDDGELGYGSYSKMVLINITTREIVEQDTDANGMYSFDVLAGNTYTIQTSFLPAGVTVFNPASSWYRENIIPTAGQTVTFDVGFHTVIEGEHSMLDLTVFIDANFNGMMDGSESGLPLTFTVYTYTIGPENITTDAQGKLLHKLVPADWAITALPAGYAPTVYSYERSDGTEGKNYNSAVLVADDPEPGSTHTMVIGLVPIS